TQGTMVTAGGGTEDRAEFTARHGGKVSDKLHYRMWAKRFDRSGLQTAADAPGDDSWHNSRGGARVDWKASDNDSFTFHGDAHGGAAGQVVQSDWPTAVGPLIHDTVRYSGSYALARWERRFSERSEMALQGGVDDQSRREWIGNGSFRQWDLDFQHRYTASSRHDLLWGAGYRRLSDRIET
ncbi:MAG: hypothetical protein GY953_52525, partial [bacterium]|nr:hypothetical protein [bacterium]